MCRIRAAVNAIVRIRCGTILATAVLDSTDDLMPQEVGENTHRIELLDCMRCSENVFVFVYWPFFLCLWFINIGSCELRKVPRKQVKMFCRTTAAWQSHQEKKAENVPTTLWLFNTWALNLRNSQVILHEDLKTYSKWDPPFKWCTGKDARICIWFWCGIQAQSHHTCKLTDHKRCEEIQSIIKSSYTN